MKSHKTLYWVATVYGITITALIIFAVFMEITSSIQYGFSSTILFHLQNSTLYYLVYLVGYAFVWRRPLKGSIVIIAISILGYLLGFREERIAYVFTFLWGFSIWPIGLMEEK